jgi:hypothetical protein
MQGNTQAGKVSEFGGVADGVGTATGDPAAEARALADSILNPPPGGDEPGSAVATAPVGEAPGQEGVVAKVDAKRGTAAPGEAAEGQEGVHAEGDKAAEPAGQVDDLEAVLKGRSERVKARMAEKQRLDAIERRAAEAERLAKDLESRAKTDPLGFLREAGYKDEDIARALLGQAEAPKANDPVAKRLEALERQLAEKQAAEQRAVQAAQQAELERGKEAVKRDFVTYVATESDEFAHLVAYYDDSPTELADRALAIAEQYKESTDQYPSFEAVARYLENDLRTRYSRITQKQQTVPAVGSAKSPPKGQTSLTATDAAPRSAPPKEPRDMTEEEARKEALKLANQLTRKR